MKMWRFDIDKFLVAIKKYFSEESTTHYLDVVYYWHGTWPVFSKSNRGIVWHMANNNITPKQTKYIFRHIYLINKETK